MTEGRSQCRREGTAANTWARGLALDFRRLQKGSTAARNAKIDMSPGAAHEVVEPQFRSGGLDLVIRWAAEDHTALRVRKNRKGEHRWRVDAIVVDLVRAMARQMPDTGIAVALNRAGKTMAKGHSWPRTRVASLRKDHGIAVYREGECAERGE